MVPAIYKAIGSAIRRNRLAIGMSQATLSDAIGLSRTSVTNIERGGQAVLVHQLVDIAAALKAPIADFLPERPANRPDESQRNVAEIESLLHRLITKADRKGRRT